MSELKLQIFYDHNLPTCDICISKFFFGRLS